MSLLFDGQCLILDVQLKGQLKILNPVKARHLIKKSHGWKCPRLYLMGFSTSHYRVQCPRPSGFTYTRRDTYTAYEDKGAFQPAALVNLGATCFVNAALQCVRKFRLEKTLTGHMDTCKRLGWIAIPSVMHCVFKKCSLSQFYCTNFLLCFMLKCVWWMPKKQESPTTWMHS